MMLSSPIETLAHALASAQYVNMPDIPDQRRKLMSQPYSGSTPEEYKKWREREWEIYNRRPFAHELYVKAMFVQGWGSTALGFGGIGGQAMTDAYTIIIGCELNCILCVYFGGEFAYNLDLTKCDIQKINEDIANENIAEISQRRRYLKK
jgi:hypothetical protein